MWVTRDKDNTLCLWTYSCPKRENYKWIASQQNSTSCIWSVAYLDKNMFPNLKWEDEPLEVDILSVIELNSLKTELNNLKSSFNSKYEDHDVY